MSTTVNAITAEASVVRTAPYGRSWVNVFNDWIERLPGPTWVAYLVAIAAGVGATFLQDVESLSNPDLTVLGTGLYYGALPFAVLLLIRSLDRTATQALHELHAILDMDAEETSATAYRLTVIPARAAAGLVAVGFGLGPLGYLLDPVASGVAGLTTGGLIARLGWETFITSLFLVLVYHTIRQLRLVDRIHERISRIDLFDQGPLYGFSRVTSRTGIGLILLLAPGLLLIPAEAGVTYLAITFVWYALAVAMAAAAFVLPLRRMHDRIAATKRDLQAQIGRRLTHTLDEIHAAVDAKDLPAIEARNRALATLIAERDLVNKVPTWPWSTGALTGFLSAVLLPVGLWIVTRTLERFV